MLHPERQWWRGRKEVGVPREMEAGSEMSRLEAGGWLWNLRPPHTPRSDFLPSLRPRGGRNETLFVPNPLVPMSGKH